MTRPQQWIDGAAFAEEAIKTVLDTMLGYMILRDYYGQGQHIQCHYICWQLTEDPSTRGDLVPEANRRARDSYNHPIGGGSTYRYALPDGQGYSAWPPMIGLAWFYGNRGNGPVEQRLRAYARELLGFRGTEEQHTVNQARGWGNTESGTDLLHRTAGVPDPYGDYEDDTHDVTLRLGGFATLGSAAPRMRLLAAGTTATTFAGITTAGVRPDSLPAAASTLTGFAGVVDEVEAIDGVLPAGGVTATAFAGIVDRVGVVGGPTGEKDYVPITGFALVGGDQALTRNVTWRFAAQARDPRFTDDPAGRGILHYDHAGDQADEFAVTRGNGTARGNANTHPTWNAGTVGDSVGPETKLWFMLRDWMGRDIATMKLGVPGLGTGGFKVPVEIVSAMAAPNNANTLRVRLTATHAYPDGYSDGIKVSFTGLSGDIPLAIDGQQFTAQRVDPITLDIPFTEAVTGTYAGSSPEITCNVGAPSFRRAEANAFDDLSTAFDCWREALRTGHRRDLDMAAVFVLVGEEDIRELRTQEEYATALTAMVEDIRLALETSSHGAKLPIIMGRLMLHSGMTGDVRTAAERFRAAQAEVGADAQVAIIDLDDIAERMDLQAGRVVFTGPEMLDVAERLHAGMRASGIVSNARTLPTDTQADGALSDQLTEADQATVVTAPTVPTTSAPGASGTVVL